VKRRIIGHPPPRGELLGSSGRGHVGPEYADVGGPAPLPPEKQKPTGAPLDPLGGLESALGSIFGTAARTVIAAGGVMLGVALMVVGLRLATGQAGRVGHTVGGATPVGRAARLLK